MGDNQYINKWVTNSGWVGDMGDMGDMGDKHSIKAKIVENN